MVAAAWSPSGQRFVLGPDLPRISHSRRKFDAEMIARDWILAPDVKDAPCFALLHKVDHEPAGRYGIDWVPLFKQRESYCLGRRPLFSQVIQKGIGAGSSGKAEDQGDAHHNCQRSERQHRLFRQSFGLSVNTDRAHWALFRVSVRLTIKDCGRRSEQQPDVVTGTSVRHMLGTAKIDRLGLLWKLLTPIDVRNRRKQQHGIRPSSLKRMSHATFVS